VKGGLKVDEKIKELAKLYGIETHNEDIEGCIVTYPDGTWKAGKDLNEDEIIELFGLDMFKPID